MVGHVCLLLPFPGQARVPLTIFRSNSKFDQDLQGSDLKCTLLITTKFCTRHDSYTVVTYAKFRCGRWRIFWGGALQILIEFQIRSKYRYWDGRQLGNRMSLKWRFLHSAFHKFAYHSGEFHLNKTRQNAATKHPVFTLPKSRIYITPVVGLANITTRTWP